MSTAEAAQLLASLVRASPDSLSQYALMSGAGQSFTPDDLTAIRALLLQVAELLHADDVTGWRAFGKHQAPVGQDSDMAVAGVAEPAVTESAALSPPPAASVRSAPPLPVSAPPLPVSAPAPGAGIDSTAWLDPIAVAEVVAAPVVPFRGEAPAPPTSAAANPHPEQGGTAAVDPSLVADALAAYPMASNLPMEVTRYASLVARTESASPAHRQTVHAEFGIESEAHRQRIDKSLGDYVGQSAFERQQYEQHLQQWRDYIRGQR